MREQWRAKFDRTLRQDAFHTFRADCHCTLLATAGRCRQQRTRATLRRRLRARLGAVIIIPDDPRGRWAFIRREGGVGGGGRVDLFSTPLVLAFIRLKRPHDRRPRPEGPPGPPCPRPNAAAAARGPGRQQGAAGFLFWSGGARARADARRRPA